MRYIRARRILVFWCIFIGIGAVAGAIGMFVDISGKTLGMDEMLPYFQVLPFADVLFQNFLFPGIALLIVNGISNLIAAGLMLMKKKLGIILGGLFGFTLMLWICIQFVIFPANFMSTTYFIFGLAQLATGYACYVFYKQETFDFNPEEYTNIGSDPTTLVVYFSRLERTAKVAYEYANKVGGNLYQIKTKERTEGTLGFWWCGRFGMHKWDMEMLPQGIDFDSYEKVVICSPVWVFSIAAPVRAFLHEAAKGDSTFLKGTIRKVSYIGVHFNPWLPKKFFDEMDEILGIKGDERHSVCCQLGKMR